jgi:hypothetical protein
MSAEATTGQRRHSMIIFPLSMRSTRIRQRSFSIVRTRGLMPGVRGLLGGAISV